MQAKTEPTTHAIEFEQDTGFLKITQVGTIDVEHAQAILSAFSKFSGSGSNFVLADNSRAEGITPEARKVLGRTNLTPGATTYFAMYGASFAFRAISNLILTAVRLSGKKFHGTVAATEAEARSWLQQKKAEQQKAQ